MTSQISIIVGDCRSVLRTLEADSVHTCITSPPYFGLRDYEEIDQIGLEPTPEEFVAAMVQVFREVRRVLRPDGTLWLNLGDSYASRPNGSIGKESTLQGEFTSHSEFRRAHALRKPTLPNGLKHKDMMGIPWRVAFALQADGWWLRQDIIWHKPNVMPESVEDRCTKAHEYIFLMSKSADYYYDAEAIMQPASPNTHARVAQNVASQAGSLRANGGTRADRPMKAVVRSPKTLANAFGVRNNSSFMDSTSDQVVTMRNKRSVWTVPTAPYREAHFATYPPDLIRDCVRAGAPVGGLVLDPFGGAGTTGLVAVQERRRATLIELSPRYARIARRRIDVAEGRMSKATASVANLNEDPERVAKAAGADLPLFTTEEAS